MRGKGRGAIGGAARGQGIAGQIGGMSKELLQAACICPSTHRQLQPARAELTLARARPAAMDHRSATLTPKAAGLARHRIAYSQISADELAVSVS